MRPPPLALHALMFISMFVTAEENLDANTIAKQTIEKFACRACHVIGSEGGGIVGPNLDQVTIRRSDEWLHEWLKEPAALKADTLMPKFDFKDAERDALVSYLHQLATPVEPKKIFAIYGYGAEAGAALVKSYQCFACHKILDQSGRMIYPDLSTVKERRNPKWEREWLKDPQAVKHGTFMPTFGFSPEEINALVEFLYQ